MSDTSAALDRLITFRPITVLDEPLLYQIYASTRVAEMDLVDWSEAQKQVFLSQQFKAQHTFYLQQFKTAQFDLIEQDGQPIGRLYVDRRPDEIRIIDIALLPNYRQQGIGTHLLQQLIHEAQSNGLPVRIHVERFNPALRLYNRLGFEAIADEGVYYLMERRAV